MSILEAAQSGDRRATLEAMRDKLSRSMDEADSNVAANLSGQLRGVLAELADLGAVGKAVKRNELGERRENRIAAASAASPAVAKGRKRGA